MKKPVIVSGYNNSYYSANNIPPFCYTSPNNIYNMIIKLIDDKLYYKYVTDNLYDYFSKLSNPYFVATRYLKIINNEIPSNWIYFPYKNDYIFGWGISKYELKQIYSYIINNYGEDKLFLEDKPLLQKKIFKFLKDLR